MLVTKIAITKCTKNIRFVTNALRGVYLLKSLCFYYRMIAPVFLSKWAVWKIVCGMEWCDNALKYYV